MSNLNKINLGCGRIHMDGFTNIDKVQIKSNVDIVIDIEKTNLPFVNNSIETIIANSVFEHISNLVFVLNECHRVLRKDGHLTGCVPVAGSEVDYQDPTHVRHFIIKTFAYFTGKSEFMGNRPSHPRYADYGVLPWKENKIEIAGDIIHFDLTPEKL